MSWNINNIYLFVQKLANKSAAGGISDEDLFYFWNSEQRAFQADLLGRFNKNSNGKDVANTGLIENDTILNKLLPFTKKGALTLTSGIAAKPARFAYTLALRIDGHKVEKVRHGQIWAVNEDVIDPPSIVDNTYYYTEYNDGYNFLPITVTTASLDYIAIPDDVVWAFTLVGGRQVYDAANSVQPLWDDISIEEITRRTLKNLGLHFKDADFANFGNVAKITGD